MPEILNLNGKPIRTALPQLAYIAQPYSSKDPFLVEFRYLAALDYAAQAIKKWGLHVFSPIVHCHEMAKTFDLPGDAEFWQTYNYNMLSRCDVMHVLDLQGAKASAGLIGELKNAQQLQTPLFLATQTSPQEFRLAETTTQELASQLR